ncbi:hypothetical protein QOZ80_8BG0641660 [Eleusine coracana subsp. coracana]|nr:hypothetical protein QOZ80_8BG0641660 [Eleusine coracana subsp. coracana]
MACSRCRLAEVWLLLIVFLLAVASGASFTTYPRTQGEEEIAMAMAMSVSVSQNQKKVDDANNNNNNSSSASPSSPPSPNGNKQSSQGKGCVTTKECHMKRLVCAKKCTLAAHKKCAAKCSSACSSYPICSSLLDIPFP